MVGLPVLSGRFSSFEVFVVLVVCCRTCSDRLTLRSTSRTCLRLVRFRLSGPRLLVDEDDAASSSLANIGRACTGVYCGEAAAAAAGEVALESGTSRIITSKSSRSRRREDACTVCTAVHLQVKAVPASARVGR